MPTMTEGRLLPSVRLLFFYLRGNHLTEVVRQMQIPVLRGAADLQGGVETSAEIKEFLQLLESSHLWVL